MFFFIVIGIILFAGLVVWGILSSAAAKKRREALRQAAQELGLQFLEGPDATYDDRFPFLKKLCQGSNRYAFNILRGAYGGHFVELFDYHYETHSSDSKGNRTTHHHYFSFYMLLHDRDFPELIICREGWFSKLVQFFGFEDIDFESAEFSRKFEVRCKDKRFAYDICHSQMIEYMLRPENGDLNIEMEGHCLTWFFVHRLDPLTIPVNLHRLVAIRELIPDYVMKG